MRWHESGHAPRLLAVAVLSAATLAGPLRADTLYVNGSCGSDAWTGTSPVCTAPEGPKATIQAGIDAADPGDEVVVAEGIYTGSGNKNLDPHGKAITIRSSGGPEACIIDCQGAGRGFWLHSGERLATVIRGFTVRNGGVGRNPGGGALLEDSSATFADCVFDQNSGNIGGAIYDGSNGASLVLERCRFTNNSAENGVGGVFAYDLNSLTMNGCAFTGNASLAIGAVGSAAAETLVVNSVFAQNDGDFVAGALGTGDGVTTLLNCLLSQNDATTGAGIESGSLHTNLLSTTVSRNVSRAIVGGWKTLNLANCVVWDNGDTPIDPTYSVVTVSFSDVQGGWPGHGNIDADPLFLSPGTDDLHLAEGSPCIDAGDAMLLPPDTLDLDGDGDVAEPLPLDLEGNPRVSGGGLDMGAYEGSSVPQKPASSETDLDQGESAILVPEGGDFDPLQSSAVLVINTTGPDNSSFVVTQYHSDIHPGAGGYSELGFVLATRSSLGDGQLFSALFVPFDQETLTWTDPLALDATILDPATGQWRLAVELNTASSPGHEGPVGDRIEVESTGNDWGITTDLGDYGVFWNPVIRRGFVWANIDRTGEVGVGNPRCTGDCDPLAGDGQVTIVDLLALLRSWGASGGGGPCDFAGDGLVDADDLAAVIGGWGPCVEPLGASGGSAGPWRVAAPSPARSGRGGWRRGAAGPLPRRPPDIDRDGQIGRSDLAAIRAWWGPCDDDCPADLDADRTVGIRDLLAILSRWEGADPQFAAAQAMPWPARAR